MGTKNNIPKLEPLEFSLCENSTFDIGCKIIHFPLLICYKYGVDGSSGITLIS